MGYDSNIKSQKSERRQRLVIVVSLIALLAAIFLVVSLLSPSPAKTTHGASGGGVAGGRVGTVSVSARLAAAKKKDRAAGLRGNDESEIVKSDAQPPPPKKMALPAAASGKTEKEAATLRADLEAQVRAIKKTGVIMETDAKSLELTGKLQDATRDLLRLRYGDFGTKRYRIKFDLEFQSTIPDFDEKGKDGTLLIEMAPISLIPCSVYNFLEIARTWKKGAFHRNAGHVLQAISRSDITQSMPFQEYSKEFPHKKGTLGYAGRPSGPEFYVSIQDNTNAHGPGSQQKHNPYEADSLSGTVIQGMEDGTVARIHTMPGKEFMGDKKKWVLIRRMHVLVPGDGPDGYVEFSKSPLVIPQD